MKKLFFNKNKILAGCLLIAINAFVSCKKLIELPGNPPNKITRSEQFADSASTLSAVVGVYTYNRTPGFPYSDANLTTSAGLSAREFAVTSSYYGDQAVFYSFTLTPSNSEITTLWQYSYASLYQVNDVLSGVTNNSNLSASFVKQITGEMEVTRAFYYFNMVNLYGGVPLVTTTDYALNAQLPRASASAIYTQIFKDLNDAVKKLPTSYPSAGRARPNLYTALALLAKAHLYQGQWQAAYNEADSVIKSNTYNLAPDLNTVFLDGSPEAIWQIPAATAYAGTAEATKFVPYSSAYLPAFIVTDSLLNQFEPGDQRFSDWLGTANVSGQTLYYPNKYKDRLPTTPATDFMIFRLGEMYLIRAEAAAQLNNLGAAMTDVNIIRARAGLVAVNPTTQTAVLAAIRQERRTELCFEWGNRWFDLNRTINDTKYPSIGQAASVLAGYQPFDALYPIPQTQILLSNHLTQNPGYH